jgi:DDE superfamily endonuclease
MSLSTLRRRVGEVAPWRRPRLVAKGDPDREQVLAQLRQAIAALPEGAVVLAKDETHRTLGADHLDRPRRLPAGHHAGNQSAADHLRRGRPGQRAVLLPGGPQGRQRDLHRFLERLLAAYPAAPVVAVVCDNVVIHRSKLVKRWLAAHPRLLVLHGACYSPHDNPVERIWGALKAWLTNSPTLTIQGRVRRVHGFFGQRTSAQMPATAAPHSSPWLPASYMQNFKEAASLCSRSTSAGGLCLASRRSRPLSLLSAAAR